MSSRTKPGYYFGYTVENITGDIFRMFNARHTINFRAEAKHGRPVVTVSSVYEHKQNRNYAAPRYLAKYQKAMSGHAAQIARDFPLYDYTTKEFLTFRQ